MNAIVRRLLTMARAVTARLVPQVQALDGRLGDLEQRWGVTNHEVTVVQRTALRRLQDDNIAMSKELLRLRGELDQLHAEVATHRVDRQESAPPR
jgi:hypothetical protein